MNESKMIYEFQKNSGEKVVVQFTEYKGKRLLDIRVFYLSDDEQWKPTKKGLTLRRELIVELKQAIDKGTEEWEKELLSPGEKEKREEGISL
jgi:hypothetical protein